MKSRAGEDQGHKVNAKPKPDYPAVSPDEAKRLLKEIGDKIPGPRKFDQLPREREAKYLSCVVCGVRCVAPLAEGNLRFIVCEPCNKKPGAYERWFVDNFPPKKSAAFAR